MHFGIISYSVGAAAFLALFLLLLTSWRGRLQGALLVNAVFINLCWAVTAVYLTSGASRLSIYSYSALEVARSIAWFAFLLPLLAPLLEPAGGWTGALFRWRYPALTALAALVLALDWQAELLHRRLGVDLSAIAHIGLAVAGLALIEQLFRNTRPEQRWASKFLYLGIGTLFAYDFFLYSDALLFRHVDPQIWYARGLVNGMVAPLIAVAAARNPAWSLEVFVSRRIVAHSISILGAGLYLLLMAGVGYYIRLYGGGWGFALQLIFLVGAAVILLALLFSGQLRAAAKLFLNKHFFNYKYDYREEWLRLINTLSPSEAGGPLRERAILAVAGLVHSNGGMLWTQGENGHYHRTAIWNMGEQGACSEADDSPFIGFLERRRMIIELDAYEAEPELYMGLTPPPWLQEIPQAWIILPLLLGERLHGFMLLARPRVRHQLNWEDHDLLLMAGRQAASYLALLDATAALIDARQFEAFNRLSAYVVHDLKNIVAQLSLVVANAARHKTNPAFVDDAIGTVENACARMQQLLGQLRKNKPAPREATLFNLQEAAREAVRLRSARRPTPTLTAASPALWLSANRESFIAVLEHLLQNAQEATAEDGRVEIKVYRAGSMAVIEIADNGCGMDARFIRDQLFRPFMTTKGNAGMGIGVYESREFVQALGGKIEVASKPGAGTTFLLRLPLAETVADRPQAQPRPETVL